jgi:hypothetical protein
MLSNNKHSNPVICLYGNYYYAMFYSPSDDSHINNLITGDQFMRYSKKNCYWFNSTITVLIDVITGRMADLSGRRRGNLTGCL